MKTLQIGLYSVLLNLPIKHVQEKEKEKKNDSKRKRTFFISTFLQFARINIEKQRYGFFISTLFLELISIFVNGMYFSFPLFAKTRHDHEMIRVKH